MRKFVVLQFAFLMAGSLVHAEDPADTAKNILDAWTSDDEPISLDAKPDGTPILVVFDQEGFAKENGYFPLKATAKAGVKSILRVYTNKTIGCSRNLLIPQFNIDSNLPATGVTEFEIPAMPAGSRLDGICSMGLYSFTISFE